jgi:hypothetical protein
MTFANTHLLLQIVINFANHRYFCRSALQPYFIHQGSTVTQAGSKIDFDDKRGLLGVTEMKGLKMLTDLSKCWIVKVVEDLFVDNEAGTVQVCQMICKYH